MIQNIAKYGVTGPHSSGKTTLLAALKNTSEFADIEFLPEVTRVIKAKGYEINEAGTQDTQILIMATHMQNLLTCKRFIVDRTLIDGLCYTRFLYNEQVGKDTKNKIQSWFMRYCEAITENYVSQYTKLFYVPAEIPIHNDGVRSTDTYFHEIIVDLFDRHIEWFAKRNPNLIVTVRGTVEERVQIVLNAIRSM